MVEEFNLSERKGTLKPFADTTWYNEEDVKEFIKRLKFKFKMDCQSGYIDDEQVEYEEFIDKLVGDDLI